MEEFEETPSGALTTTEFNSIDLEEECDPPAFLLALKKKEKEKLAIDYPVEELRQLADVLTLALTNGQNEDESLPPTPSPTTAATASTSASTTASTTSTTNEHAPVLALPSTITPTIGSSSASSHALHRPNVAARRQSSANYIPKAFLTGANNTNVTTNNNTNNNTSTSSNAIVLSKQPTGTSSTTSSSTSSSSSSSQSTIVSKAIVPLALFWDSGNVEDEDPDLSDFEDDDEIQSVILSKDEIIIKSRLWHNVHKDYLAQQKGKGI